MLNELAFIDRLSLGEAMMIHALNRWLNSECSVSFLRDGINMTVGFQFWLIAWLAHSMSHEGSACLKSTISVLGWLPRDRRLLACFFGWLCGVWLNMLARVAGFLPRLWRATLYERTAACVVLFSIDFDDVAFTHVSYLTNALMLTILNPLVIPSKSIHTIRTTTWII